MVYTVHFRYRGESTVLMNYRNGCIYTQILNKKFNYNPTTQNLFLFTTKETQKQMIERKCSLVELQK